MTGYRHGIGPVQAELIRRARESSAGCVMLGGYREIRAARVLVKRKIMIQLIGWPRCFGLVKEWRKS